MTDPALMRGEDWVRCCICGEMHHLPPDDPDPFRNLFVDDAHIVWDVCKGQCAVDAGLSRT